MCEYTPLEKRSCACVGVCPSSAHGANIPRRVLLSMARTLRRIASVGVARPIENVVVRDIPRKPHAREHKRSECRVHVIHPLIPNYQCDGMCGRTAVPVSFTHGYSLWEKNGVRSLNAESMVARRPSLRERQRACSHRVTSVAKGSGTADSPNTCSQHELPTRSRHAYFGTRALAQHKDEDATACVGPPDEKKSRRLSIYRVD